MWTQNTDGLKFVYYTLQTMTETLELLQNWDMDRLSGSEKQVKETIHALNLVRTPNQAHKSTDSR